VFYNHYYYHYQMENLCNEKNCFDDKNLDKNAVDIVLYHGSCFDGFGSAFVVWLYYKSNYNIEHANSIKYIPCYYLKESANLTTEFLDQMKGKNILMCDFSYKYNHLVQLVSVAKTFMILDHHKTAEEDLKKIPEHLKIFDMKRSGTGITWDLFFTDVGMPKFLAYIQDRDIWSKKYEETTEFVTFFYEQEFNFESWETYLKESMVEKAIETGKKWLEYQNLLLNRIIKKTSYVIQEINGQYSIVLYLNSSEFKSDVGNKVFNNLPIGDFSCVWDYNLYMNQTVYSLRSTNDRFDVSVIASNFGGGGHRNASGCIFTGIVERLPYKMIEDPGILALLLHGTKGKFTMAKEENSYALFKVKEICSAWLNKEYFDLIKRKYCDCMFIVFEKQADMVDIDRKTGCIIPLKEYNLFFNEKAAGDPEKILLYMACGSKDHALTFNTTKDFAQLFEEYNINDPINDTDE
jgi:uncharacterized protein